jgi:hypothetical protein
MDADGRNDEAATGGLTLQRRRPSTSDLEASMAQAIDAAIVAIAQVVKLLIIYGLRRLVVLAGSRKRMTYLAASLAVAGGIVRFLVLPGR